MNVGVLGPADSVAHVVKVAEKKEPHIRLIPMVYKTYPEAAEILKGKQRELDGVLFTGFEIFTYVSGLVKPLVPWEYTSCNVMTLACSILLARSKGFDITKMSFDGFGTMENIVLKAYLEIGYTPDQIEIYVPRRRKNNERNYVDYLFDFHTDLYKSQKISCSIHGISESYARLKDSGLPCFRRMFFSDPVRDQLIKLRLRHQISENRGSNVAVISVETEVVDHYAVYGKSELESFYRKKQVVESIYLFAQKIGAALVESSGGRHYIFTNTPTLRSETNNFKNFDLLDRLVADGAVNRVHIGVGMGKNAFEAKSNGDYGREKSCLSGENSVYVVFGDRVVHGPLTPSGATPRNMQNSRLQEISRRSGLGLVTVKKLDQVLRQYRVDVITPVDLARIYGVTPRSMNRIISKLEEAGGCVQNMGTDVRQEAGRPSRLIKINLN